LLVLQPLALALDRDEGLGAVRERLAVVTELELDQLRVHDDRAADRDDVTVLVAGARPAVDVAVGEASVAVDVDEAQARLVVERDLDDRRVRHSGARLAQRVEEAVGLVDLDRLDVDRAALVLRILRAGRRVRQCDEQQRAQSDSDPRLPHAYLILLVLARR
jgi:hypothetical protein